MEPIVNKEGFAVMQDAQKARKLLNNYYSKMGFTVVNAQTKDAASLVREKFISKKKTGSQD